MPAVLIVEDNPANRDLLERRLQRVGCRVVSLSEGREVLPVAERERPDLIILDMRLPDIDGLELTRRLKAHADLRAIPVAILTASVREEDARLAYGAGCDAFLTKPFVWADLWSKLQALLPPAARTA